jgi:lysosomal Pro-X carboxypeptidase
MIKISFFFAALIFCFAVIFADAKSSGTTTPRPLKRRSPMSRLIQEVHEHRTKTGDAFFHDAIRAGKKLTLTPEDCETHWYTQPMDHFSAQPPPAPFPASFQQRYFVCGRSQWNPNQPIFFYCGNEVDVTLFKNLTGLMYENYQTSAGNALLVFSEARGFGRSLLFPGQSQILTKPQLRYLTTDQIIQDHAALASHLKYTAYGNSTASKIIAFGGSWGGMLATYVRIKFPDLFQGAIAGSAPVRNFEQMNPSYDPNAIAKVQTNDAQPLPSGEATTAHCVDNIRQAWLDIQTLSETSEGQATLTSALSLCSPYDPSQLWDLINYLAAPFADLAMSSYSFPSAYLLLSQGNGVLPAYPMKNACAPFSQPVSATTPKQRVSALLSGLLVYFNASGEFTCLNFNNQINEQTTVTDWLWGYLACGAMAMPSGQTGATGPAGDMFWDAPWNKTAYTESCQSTYDATPDYEWTRRNFGDFTSYATNIFFSSGSLDIWTPGDITEIPASRQQYLTAAIIPRQGHHADLFFSNKDDTPGLAAVRKMEVQKINEWLQQQ